MDKLKSSERARELRLKKFFNLTPVQWNVLDIFQKSLCFVCNKPQKSGKRLAVDHSHNSGIIRCLLCSTCNRALGKMERTWPKGTDVALMLARMIEVLTDPPAVKALGKPVYTFPGRFGTKRHKKWLLEQRKSEPK